MQTLSKSVKTPFSESRCSYFWKDPILINLLRCEVILLTQPMAVLLNLWTALLLGILYLFFNAFPITFMGKHGL
jgi:hypothetical protein